MLFHHSEHWVGSIVVRMGCHRTPSVQFIARFACDLFDVSVKVGDDTIHIKMYS
jgi:hypothetical protein